MENWLTPGDRVLDLGTGSGILALAAVQTGASAVVALDTDPRSLTTVQRNMELNRVDGRMEIRLGNLDVIAEETFDAITANLLARILWSMVPALRSKLCAEGLLIVSGVRSLRGGQLIRHLQENGFEVLERMSEEGWDGLAFRKRGLPDPA
jgi:ribosomal protein L11 methyltransferase